MQTLYFGEREPRPEPLPAPGAWRTFVPATDRELLSLWSIVKAARPEFCRCDDMRAFAVAFGFCQAIGRATTVNRKHYATHWGELAELWAKSIGAPSINVDAQVFAAAIASADIAYQLPSVGWGAALGLLEFGGRRSDQIELNDGYGGTMLKTTKTRRWQLLLANEVKLLPPIEPPPLPDTPQSTYEGRETRILSNGREYGRLEPWNPG